MECRKIYAYSTKSYYDYRISHQDIPWFKIGDTEQLTEDRVKQQDKTANPEELIIHKEWDVPIKYHDHDVHNQMGNNGVYRVRTNREWFECTIVDIESAISQVTGIMDFRKDMIPYPHQIDTLDFLEKNWNIFDSFLLNHKPRSGKTFIILFLLQKHIMELKNVLLLTNYPILNNQWKDVAILFKNFGYNIIVSNEIENGENIILSDTQPNLLLMSFQDAKGNNDLNTEEYGLVKNKFKRIDKEKWDLLIIDEVHIGKETYKTDKFLKSIDYKKLIGL